jgi:hypothetical protein
LVLPDQSGRARANRTRLRQRNPETGAAVVVEGDWRTVFG